MNSQQQDYNLSNVKKLLNSNLIIYQLVIPDSDYICYLIESEEEYALVYLMEHLDRYFESFNQYNVKLKYIFETNYNQSLLPVYLQIQQQLKTKVIIGDFQSNDDDLFQISLHQQKFQLGFFNLQVIHTPGFSQESSTILILDQQNNTPIYALTGNTITYNNISIPRNIKERKDKTKIIDQYFESIQLISQLLNQETIILFKQFTKNNSRCPFQIFKDTMQSQKQNNPALSSDKQDFISFVNSDPSEQTITPTKKSNMSRAKGNFAIKRNSGIFNDNNDRIDKNKVDFLNLKDFQSLDFRQNASNYLIKGFQHIYFNIKKQKLQKFINKDEKIQFICSPQLGPIHSLELVQEGFDQVSGYEEDFSKIPQEIIFKYETISAQNYVNLKNPYTIDIRSNQKFQKINIQHSFNVINLFFQSKIPLNLLKENLNFFKLEFQYYIIASNPEKAIVAASILLNNSYKNFIVFNDSFNKLQQLNYKLLQQNDFKRKQQKAKTTCICLSQ